MSFFQEKLRILSGIRKAGTRTDDDGRIYRLADRQGLVVNLEYKARVRSNAVFQKTLPRQRYHLVPSMDITVTPNNGKPAVEVHLENPRMRFLPEGSETGESELPPQKILFTSDNNKTAVITAEEIKFVYQTNK